MISSGTRLMIGTIVGFFSGLGLIGISAKDTQYLTNNIDSLIGGAIALVSLIGFIYHHIHDTKVEKAVAAANEAASQPVQ